MKKLKEKIENLTKTQQFLVLLLLIIMLGGLIYLTTIDVIQKVEYSQHGAVVCSEIYINGKLNGTPCPQNPKYNEEGEWYQTSNPGLENLKLNLTQS